MMGKPTSLAISTASSGSVTIPFEPGTVGTSWSIMVLRAVALSPMARICSGVGPMKAMPERPQISLNSAFSARKP